MSRVLVADDEEGLLDVMADVLGEMGHDVLRALDGEEALALAREHRPDVIVSDHMMPRRTGLELLRAVRDDPALASTRFVLVSAALPADAHEADDVASKPLRLDDFERMVEQQVAAGRAAHERRDRPAPADGSVVTLAREQLLDWVAHQLRTPLSAALLNQQVLGRELASGPHAPRASAVLRELERLQGFVSSLVDAERLVVGRAPMRRDLADLGELLRVATVAWQAGHPGVEIVLRAPTRAVRARCDSGGVRLALDEMVASAVEHGPPSRPIEVQLTSDAAALSISVRDHGPAVTLAELPGIFDRSGAEPGGRAGNGLRLFVASRVAHRHGGTIEVRAPEGGGAAFVLRLPLDAGCE
jgi:signal transduction histidine kinase